METLVIKSSEWLRGRLSHKGLAGFDKTYIDSGLFKRNRMCCLGIDAVRCGFNKKEIAPYRLPDEIAHNHPNSHLFNERKHDYINRWTIKGDANDISIKLSAINDNSYTTDAQKIAEMTPLFAELGIKLEFIQNDDTRL